jgi:hypothetical protein
MKKMEWSTLIDAFLNGQYQLCIDQGRYGLRCRIFSRLVELLLIHDGIPFESEISFKPKVIPIKFTENAENYGENLKIRKKSYIIDFLIHDDIWLEATLNEQETHKKTFKYAHQCKKLIVLFLDKTPIIHKKNIFSNAVVIPVDEYFSETSLSIYKTHIHHLRKYKGIIP